MGIQQLKFTRLIHFILVISILVSGVGIATVSAQSSFPSTAVLDNFNRANGGLGSTWGGYANAFGIASNQADVVSGGFDTYTFWNSTFFGADQEAFFTFSQVDADAPEQSILLKSQNSSSYGNGVIEILYDANADVVQVWTFHPTGGWVQRGANIPVTFVNGDQFGARARAAGTVEVYKNGALLASRSITGWALYASGGYIGVWFANAADARFDDFGGGNFSSSPTNTPTVVPTNTATSTPTVTLTATQTNTPAPVTETLTPTNTVLPTFTFTSTPDFTPTNTSIPTSTFTSTATLPPTNTFTPIPTSTAAQDIYRVATNGVSNSSCGANWSNPCDLQYALSTLANANDQLWIKQGVYTPGNNRSSSFDLKNGIALYGGFNGTETALNQRNSNPATNNTVLSGDIGTIGAIADNVYHVLTAYSVAAVTLDGLTISGGNANAATGNFGGGLYSENSNPTLVNIIFSNNSTNGAGGAMFAVTNNQTLRVNYTAPILTRVVFSGNTAARGGGLFTQNSSPVLTDVIFIGNLANGGAGGGMNNQVLDEIVDEYSIPLLNNVTFSGNTANGGGGLFNNNSNPVLTNVTFSGNTANIRGGAMLNEGGDPILRNVTMSGNTAPAGFGGSMRNIINAVGESSNPKIYNSILWGNGTEEITSDGTGQTTLIDSVMQGGCPSSAVCTNVINANPNLNALANNGGYTQTRALDTGSSAIDTGGVNSACPAVDQRGITRPQGNGCDIGSYEAAGAFVPTNTPTNTAVPTATFTPTNTATAAPTDTPIPPTATFTATEEPTLTATSVPTDTPTFTPTFTATFTPVPPTATLTPTNTPIPPTATFTPTNTATFTPTFTPTNTSTFTPTATNTPVSTDVLYLSSSTNGTAGGVAFADEDILQHNRATNTWSMYFDGSDVGVTSDVDAFALMSDGTILMSLDADVTVGSLGTVDDSDIIRFTPTSLGSNTAGTFTWYFDGSDVGLTTTAEDVDAFDFAPDGKLVISTLGSFSVTGVSGNDEDLIVFTATALGSTTSGTWALYFDGSDVGLNEATSEQIGGVWIDPISNRLYLTAAGAFTVTGVTGDGADIFICTPGTLGAATTCTYTQYWDGSANGFAGEIVDGLDIVK